MTATCARKLGTRIVPLLPALRPPTLNALVPASPVSRRRGGADAGLARRMGDSRVGFWLGVDLETTFVAAAVARDLDGPGDGVPEMFTLGDRSVVAPAVVHLFRLHR